MPVTPLRWGHVSWNTPGAKWQPAGVVNKIHVSKIACNVRNLTIPVKIVKSTDLILKGTNNPLVPGNADEITDLTARQTALVAANNAYEAARTACKQALSARNDAAAAWLGSVYALAGATEAITGGNETAILSAGFDVVSPRTPPQPLYAPLNLRVETNGRPGVTKTSWEPLYGAKTYILQRCPDPIEEAKWTTIATPTRADCETDGCQPGKQSWFRAAGVNPKGQGPYSEPAPRPVM